MDCDLLTKWLAWYDPIHHGWTRLGIANGVCATNGFSFPRIRGGYNLYRTEDGVPSPYLEPAGSAGAEASTVRTFPWVSHYWETGYHYQLVPVGGGGVENWADEVVTSFVTNAIGDWNGRVPNSPTDLQIVPLSCGRFAVRWTYLPQGQDVEPAGFVLYTTHEGVLEYGSVRGSVPYNPGRIHYEYITQSKPDGERVGWAVRAHSPDGYEENNMNQVYAMARNQPPPINPVVMLTVA